MADGFANVRGVTNAKIEAVEEILNDVITLLGATTNTGGTVTAGTIMAKLNKTLQNDIDLNTLLGTTANTGGTTTAGTVMAKLNKLLTDWTSTRAGYLDLLNRGVGVKNIQRGFFSVSIKDGKPLEEDYKITLSTIVPSKTIILTHGFMFDTSGTIAEGRVDYISSTYFEYIPGWSGKVNGSYGIRWEAIEFY